MKESIRHVYESMQFYQDTYPDDACICVFDKEKVLGFLPAENMDVKIEVGESIEKYSGTVAVEALRTGKKLRQERNADFLGFAYITTGTPIVENGEVVGAIAVTVKNDKMETLRSSASELAAMVEEMTATSDTVANASNNVAKRVENLAGISDSVHTDIAKIESIVSFVQEVANQSNLLGLNAAIEAARAGEHGRGFAVVANEVRKLAEKSKESAIAIAEQMVNIQKAVEILNDGVQQITADMEENASSVQELKSAFDHIARTADSLTQLS